MGKKKNNGGNNENNKKEANDAAAENKVTLKIDIHCEGCIRDIDKCLWDSKGVESVKISREKGTVTITGSKEMNPLKVVQRLQKKTKKIPTLLPPQPNKESKGGGGEGGDKKNNNGRPGGGGEGGEKKNNNGNPGAGGEGGDKKNNTGGGGGGKGEKKDNDSGGDQKGKDAKKSDEKGVLILKIDPPCQGCFKRAMKLIRKTKGEVIKVEVSAAKDAITVKGTKKALEFVKEKLPKTVKTTVPPPPKKDGAAGKDNNGGGGKNGEAFQIAGLPSRFGYAWSPSSMPGFSEGGSTAAVYPPELEPAPGIPSGYGAGYVYGPGFGYAVYRAPAPQMFSDENPNACSVM